MKLFFISQFSRVRTETIRILCIFLVCAQLAPRLSFAAGEDLPRVPSVPSAPPVLSRKRPSNPIECQRFFVHRGKTYTCDSVLANDAEGLRPLLHDEPEAVAALDQYQHNRSKLKKAAYVGSVGIALFLTGLIAPRFFSKVDDQKQIRSVGYLGGLSIMTATGLFGYFTLKSNESNLGRAVDIYNQKRPNDQIELQFTTGILF